MKLVILDRDGTINMDRDDYVKSVDEWVPIPNALEAIAKLNQAGFTVVVATNQSGLGRGLYGMTELNAMHEKMQGLLRNVGGRVDAFFFCPHSPASGEPPCHCRKPLPGLFEEIRERYGMDMTNVRTAGDSLRDLQAGASVGCPTHLVCTGKSQYKIPEGLPIGTIIHADLLAFAEWVVAHERSD